MALVLANRVQETSTTTGTGTLTLAGAVLGYQTFAAGIGSGNTCYYAITSSTGAWEVGIGTVGTGTLARTTLLSSSTGSLVSFTGTLNVYVTYPSEKSVNLDASNNLTVLNTTRLGGAAGNQSLQVNNVASAVNYLQAVGAVTGGIPTISAQGTDANIALGIFQKGTGELYLGGSATYPSLRVSTPVNTVNSFQIYGNATGGAVSLNALGLDANISMSIGSKGTGVISLYGNASETFRFSNVNGSDFTNYYTTSGQLTYIASGSSTNTSFKFEAKGTGSIQLASGGGTQAVVSNTASAVNYLGLTGAATGAAPTISAQGSDANIGLVLSGKGTGVVALGGTTAANSGFVVSPVASSVNYIQAAGVATGGNPLLSTQGTNTDITLRIQNKGVLPYYGTQFENSAGGVNFQICSRASSVNYFRSNPATTGNAPELSVQGSDTNINLKLVPQGTGGVWFTGPLLPNNLAGTSGQVLTSAGAGAVPTWAAAVSSNITANGLFENNATISANYTIGSGNNAVSAGPITINSGVVVTVPSGSTWVVV
jgi:hypothetical protein